MRPWVQLLITHITKSCWIGELQIQWEIQSQKKKKPQKNKHHHQNTKQNTHRKQLKKMPYVDLWLLHPHREMFTCICIYTHQIIIVYTLTKISRHGKETVPSTYCFVILTIGCAAFIWFGDARDYLTHDTQVFYQLRNISSPIHPHCYPYLSLTHRVSTCRSF